MSRSRARVRHMTAVIAACGAGAAGCGGGDEGPRRTITLEPGEELHVAGDEYSFDPGTVIVLRRGRLRLTLENDGGLPHNLRVFEDDRELGGTETFAAGDAGSAELRLEPGRYRMVCTVGDHEELGMEGTLEVR